MIDEMAAVFRLRRAQFLAEAAAARLPILATPIGAVPEVVLDGRNGLLVPVGTPSELRLAL